MELLDLHLGRPLVRGGLTLFPVWNSAAVAARGYDLRSSRLSVSEHADLPVVEQLVVRNAGDRPALVLEGELLEGGQQHRLAARSALVGARQAHVLDVRCVEEGRWHGAGSHLRAGRRAPLTVRAGRDQSEVWQRVRSMEQRYDASGTHSLLDATRRAEGRAGASVAGLRPLPFTCGVLVGIAGQPAVLEVFDSPRSFAHAWDGLVRSVALEALTATPVPTPGRRARRFLDRLPQVSVDRTAAGVGTGLHGETAYARLAALEWRGRVVHAVATNPRHELLAAA
jgi:hypothetical protein